MRIAVVGSRAFKDKTLMGLVLGKYAHREPTIVSGGASGADSIAEEWAKAMGLEMVVIQPDWARYGKRAGFLRNQSIIEGADRVLVFYGPEGRSKGAGHTEDLARAAGIPVEIYYEETSL